MSQGSSENDIWEYKPLRKTKKHNDRQNPPDPGQCNGKGKLDSTPERSPSNKRKRAINRLTTKARCSIEKQSRNDRSHSKQESQSIPLPPPLSDATCPGTTTAVVETSKSAPTKGHCPICQMPFSILVVQSQRWHVAECIETPGNDTTECPEGVQCSSTIPSHYKKYSHFLLAHTRAITYDSDLLASGESLGDPTASFSPSSVTTTNGRHTDTPVNSPSDYTLTLPSNLTPSVSPCPVLATPLSLSPSNALLLLRSPALGDIKKKKGWSPSGKGARPQTKSKVSSQAGVDIENQPPTCGHSTVMDLKTNTAADSTLPLVSDGCLDQATHLKREGSPNSNEDDYISYSPLSDLPCEKQEGFDQARRELFIKENSRDSLECLSESALSETDDLFIACMDQQNSLDHPLVKVTCNTSSQLTSNSSKPKDEMGTVQPMAETQTSFLIASTLNSKSTHSGSYQSPQSLVLEQLRDHISNQAYPPGVEDPLCSQFNRDISSSQTLSLPASSQSHQSLAMAPGKLQGKMGGSSSASSTSSGLKQTDIGVFFGLKPLREAAKKTEDGAAAGGDQAAPPTGLLSSKTSTTGASRSGWRGRRGWTGGSSESGTRREPNGGDTQSSENGAGRRQGGRWSRWNRGEGSGEQAPRPCPFYKKIPGTPFVVDAFNYGPIEGISAYFLTHFHSDHYGGLTKASTLPIYCNKITGNLVKSKLRVDDKYVHVLPMNTEVTVDGVKVILVDANHCPGSAMLLFTLPNGQRVLHTGDFRADPSMERYPEIQGPRVHTLYLDTTYCSPEYTFPTQQEVITFAANRAFEEVTLKPRTLVVCGTYSVGKEKVFLAVADVLGCKVCLSRDKFNTMCCLESPQIRQSITTDWKAAQVHVLPMMQLNFKNLQAYLKRFSDKYDQVLAFKPTGWTFNQGSSLDQLLPQTQGNITIYGIPYSEHSSYLELKRFVQWLRPLKIVPTVNVGSWRSRKAMEQCFADWDAELRARL